MNVNEALNAMVLAARKFVPSAAMNKPTQCDILKEWKNTGKSQPYENAVKYDLGIDIVDVYYYPDNSIWKVCLYSHFKDYSIYYTARFDDGELDLREVKIELHPDAKAKLIKLG